jgi:hypothetical protein
MTGMMKKDARGKIYCAKTSGCDLRYLSNPHVIAEELNKLYDWSPEYLKKRFRKYNFNTAWDVELYERIAYMEDRHLTTGFKVVKKTKLTVDKSYSMWYY